MGFIRDFRKPNPEKPMTILDSHTKQEPQGLAEIREHEEIVTVQQHVRRRPKRPGEPEVRVRQGSNSQEWQKVKRGEDE
jgi:hypothetical protein